MGYNSKIAALLGNGPSRKFYDPSKVYDYRLGCNIPWADVDATLILDENIIKLWDKDHDLIKVPVYISREAWRYGDELKTFRPFIKQNKLLISIVDKIPKSNESSGNVAARKLVELGYKRIDVYGCDAAVTASPGHNINSYTRKFISGINMITELKTSKQYRDKALEEGLAIEVRPNFLMFNVLDNARLSFETYEEYKFRQKVTRRTSKKYLNPKN